MESLERHRRNEVNAYSLTSAVGFNGIFGAFASKDAPKSKYTDLLPYQDKESERRNISPRTARILASLIKRDVLPSQVMGVASSIAEVQSLLN